MTTVVNLGGINEPNTGFGAFASITCANAVAAGTLVIAFIYDGNNPATLSTGQTVTDSKGNTYTGIVLKSESNSANVQMWYSIITTPLTTSDTIHYNLPPGYVNDYANLTAVAVNGYITLDNATTNSNSNSGSVPYSVTGAGSAAFINEIYFCVTANDGGSAATATGWTACPSNPGLTGYFLAEYQINSGTSALTATGPGASGDWAAAIVSFEAVIPPNAISLSGNITFTGNIKIIA